MHSQFGCVLELLHSNAARLLYQAGVGNSEAQQLQLTVC